jgi:hypothetical protein
MPTGGDALSPQRRVDRIRAFRAELERSGVVRLSREHAGAVERTHAAILASLTHQYDVDVTDSARQISLGMRIAALSGSLAFGAAIVLFAYGIWGLLDPASRVVMLTAGPLAALGLTALAARLDRTK